VISPDFGSGLFHRRVKHRRERSHHSAAAAQSRSTKQSTQAGFCAQARQVLLQHVGHFLCKFSGTPWRRRMSRPVALLWSAQPACGMMSMRPKTFSIKRGSLNRPRMHSAIVGTTWPKVFGYGRLDVKPRSIAHSFCENSVWPARARSPGRRRFLKSLPSAALPLHRMPDAGANHTLCFTFNNMSLAQRQSNGYRERIGSPAFSGKTMTST